MGSNRFVINEYGVIERKESGFTELENRMFTILRVGKAEGKPLSAYRARKTCYKLAKQMNMTVDYKPYVCGFMLDNFEEEFHKAEDGSRIIIFKLLFIVSSVFTSFFTLVTIGYLFDGDESLLPYFIVFLFITAALTVLWVWKKKQITEKYGLNDGFPRH